MRKREIVRSGMMQTAALTAGALIHTAWKDHRTKTHRSIELSPATDLAMDIAGGAFTDSNRWAAVHRIHHSTPDANLYPAVQFADMMTWLENHPEVRDGYRIPEAVRGLDPAVPEMSLQEAVTLGEKARQLVAGAYQPKADYTPEEIEQLLYASEPRYLYEAPKGDKNAVPMVDENATLWDLRYLLRDPHSPALHPDGMLGIAVNNRPLYEDTVEFFERNPQFMPEDIMETAREKWIWEHKKAVRWGMVGANVVARVIAERSRTVPEVARSSARGAAVAGVATLALIAGGNVVNSLGHGGEVKLSSKQFWKEIATGRVRPKDNGTYTTNNRLLSPPTLGEVGGQYEHHEDPSLIAYTHETGPKKWATDPFGAVTELLAKRGIGMKVGQGFDGARPDMPSEALLYLEELRRGALRNEV